MESPKKPDITGTVLREFDTLIEDVFGTLHWLHTWVTENEFHMMLTGELDSLSIKVVHPWGVRLVLDQAVYIQQGDILRVFNGNVSEVIQEYAYDS